MFVKLSYKLAWMILLAIAAAAVTMVFVPVWLIQPFAAQTQRQVEISYVLRTWSPHLTIVFALAAVALAVYLWRNSKRRFAKAVLLAPLLIIFLFAWLARQNHFEWMFNPLPDAAYARAAEVDFVADGEMVMAVNINGDAVAYPVRLMAYHHIVQDVVGGQPITATY